MPFATINGIRVNYLVQGSGPHLLMFAPGGFRSLISRWTAEGGKGVFQQMDALNALSRHFTVIAYDRRECGLSGGRIEPLSWDLYADEARGVLEAAGAKQAWVLGGCMGASLAMRLALRHRDACRGLLLHWPVGGYRWLRNMRAMFQVHIDFVQHHGMEALLTRTPGSDNFFLDPEMGPWGSPALVYPEFARELAAQDVDGYVAILRRSRDQLFADTMPSGMSGEEMMGLSIPSLVMSGRDESHPASAGWTVAELIPGAERWDVLPPEQTGQNTLGRMLAFVESVEGSRFLG